MTGFDPDKPQHVARTLALTGYPKAAIADALRHEFRLSLQRAEELTSEALEHAEQSNARVDAEVERNADAVTSEHDLTQTMHPKEDA